MLEIDVTHMIADADDMPLLSGSVFELGDNAGAITWRNSVAYAEKQPLLQEDQIEEARDYFASYGAWSTEEVAAWSAEEVQGLVVQEVAAQIREMEAYETYDEYQEAASNGQVSGQLYKSDDNRWYISLSN
jgi:hypothetical protein